jgi:hypothetical protein
MSKRQKKQSPEPTEVSVPLEIALSLLRPDELEKLKRYLIMYKEKYGFEDDAKARESEESKEPLMVSITKPFLVKLQSSTVQELATLHHCALRISETQPGAHIVTFPVGTCLPKGDTGRPQLHLPDGYICTLVWHDGYFHWNEETDEPTKEETR